MKNFSTILLLLLALLSPALLTAQEGGGSGEGGLGTGTATTTITITIDTVGHLDSFYVAEARRITYTPSGAYQEQSFGKLFADSAAFNAYIDYVDQRSLDMEARRDAIEKELDINLNRALILKNLRNTYYEGRGGTGIEKLVKEAPSELNVDPGEAQPMPKTRTKATPPADQKPPKKKRRKPGG